MATVDANGTLGRDTTLIPAVNALQATQAGQATQIGQLQTTQTAQGSQIATLRTDVSGQGSQISSLRTDVSAQAGQITAIRADMGTQAARIAAIEGTQSTLGGRVDALIALREEDRRDLQQGIAAAVAMGQAHFPSSPGRTSYVFNLATFRGEQAVGGSLMHRLPGDTPIAVTVGFSHAGQRNTAARVGVAGEF